MNLLDYVMICIVLYCLIRGVFRGVVRELASIVGVFAGYYAAYTYYPFVAAIISKWMSNVSYLNVICYFIIFILVLVSISLSGMVIKYLLNICDLGWIDRVFGSLFGMAKGVLIVAVILVALTAFLPNHRTIVGKSYFSPMVTGLSENMASLFKSKLKTRFQFNLRELKEQWKSAR